MRRAALVVAVPIVLAAVTPWLGSRYHVSFLFFLCMAVVLTATYDIGAGYMGYINLGHGAFFGLGAYVYGLTVTHGGPTAAALLLGAAAAALFAALVGIPLFHLRGAYFAISTFGILKIMEILAANLRGITGGTTGLSIAPTRSTFPTFYLMLVLAVAAVGLNAWIARSRLGLGLLGIREDEEVAEVSGIDTSRLKRVAFVLSALLPGLAGGVYMWQMTYVDPASAFGTSVSFAPIIMAALGGSGTVAGPVVGAVSLTLVEELLWSRLGYLQLAMYGAVLVFVGIFMPGGLMRSRAFGRAYAALGLPEHYGYRVGTRTVRSRRSHPSPTASNSCPVHAADSEPVGGEGRGAGS
ncbi:MAG: branched-chain amino acid ABC transporter permease [Candidatus Rokubacteria bacterium]|nr:branched-chain amino acid ABC transporter permease [Candidatus Rokubacteria bacterium]